MDKQKQNCDYLVTIISNGDGEKNYLQDEVTFLVWIKIYVMLMETETFLSIVLCWIHCNFPEIHWRTNSTIEIIESFGSEGNPRGHLVQPPIVLETRGSWQGYLAGLFHYCSCRTSKRRC